MGTSTSREPKYKRQKQEKLGNGERPRQCWSSSNTEPEQWNVDGKLQSALLTQEGVVLSSPTGDLSETWLLENLCCVTPDKKDCCRWDFHFMPKSNAQATDLVYNHRIYIIRHVTTKEPCPSSIIEALIFSLDSLQNNRKPVLILLNPFSGKKEASKLFHTKSEPLLLAAKVAFVLVTTTYSGEAEIIARNLALDDYSGICTVSGDGLLHEVLNGLLSSYSRPDWERGLEIPLGNFPAGTGNAMCCTLGLTFETSSFYIAKQLTLSVDLFLILSPDFFRWGFVQILWGILADIDFGSEKIRCLGSARETFWGFFLTLWYFIVNPTHNSARMCYLPSSQELEQQNINISRANLISAVNGDNSFPQHIRGYFQENHIFARQPPPEGWIEADVATCFSCQNLPFLTPTINSCPEARANDGCLSIGFHPVHSRKEIYNTLKNFTNGNWGTHVQVSELTLEPELTASTRMGVDGEQFPPGPFYCRVFPHVVKFFGPS